MIWFNYKYLSFIEVIDNIKTFNNYSFIELIVLVLSITIMILLIFYILPFFKLYLAVLISSIYWILNANALPTVP